LPGNKPKHGGSVKASPTTTNITKGKKQMNIIVKNREVYGNVLTYPICEKAKTFAKISNHKTLTRETLQGIRELGYEVIYKNV
jgi:hypothetical protein